MSSIESSTIVVREELAAAGAAMNGMAQGIADELDQLMRQLAPLQEEWVTPAGGAADKYYDAQLAWNSAAEGLFGPQGVLGEIAARMNVIWNNYAETDWANGSLF